MQNNAKNIKHAEPDLKKIFLTAPNTTCERVTWLVLMVVVFVMFFGPLCFTDVHPIRAIFLASLPAFSISWGWVVLLRSLFRKSEFCKTSDE